MLRTLKLSGHVGFDSLPSQLVNKSVQNGFLFNILCIGTKNVNLILIISAICLFNIGLFSNLWYIFRPNLYIC